MRASEEISCSPLLSLPRYASRIPTLLYQSVRGWGVETQSAHMWFSERACVHAQAKGWLCDERAHIDTHAIHNLFLSAHTYAYYSHSLLAPTPLLHSTSSCLACLPGVRQVKRAAHKLTLSDEILRGGMGRGTSQSCCWRDVPLGACRRHKVDASGEVKAASHVANGQLPEDVCGSVKEDWPDASHREGVGREQQQDLPLLKLDVPSEWVDTLDGMGNQIPARCFSWARALRTLGSGVGDGGGRGGKVSPVAQASACTRALPPCLAVPRPLYLRAMLSFCLVAA